MNIRIFDRNITKLVRIINKKIIITDNIFYEIIKIEIKK